MTVASGATFLHQLEKAAAVFPGSEATPFYTAHSMEAAAASNSLAATASSSLPSANHPMSSTKDSPLTPGTALSTLSKRPER